MSTSQTPKQSSQQTTQKQLHRNLKPFIRQFVHEVVEIAIFLYIISMVTDKQLSWSKLARISIVIGLLQTAIELFDHDRHTKIKDGMLFSVGSSVFI